MLFLFGLPTDIEWTVSGVGAAIDASLTAANLTDGRPGIATRFSWLSGAQTTASVLRLRGTWTSGAIVPRGAALIGLSLPSGQKIEVTGKRPADVGFDYDLGGNSTSQRSVDRDDAEVRATYVFDDGLDPIEGVEFALYNDVSGVAAIAASTVFDIGEAVIAMGLSVAGYVQREWDTEPVDATESRRSLSKQNWPVGRIAYERLPVTLKWLATRDIYGKADGSIPITIRQLDRYLAGQQPCMVIPRWNEPDTDEGRWLIQQTSLFGSCSKSGKRPHLRGDYWGKDYEFESNPVP